VKLIEAGPGADGLAWARWPGRAGPMHFRQRKKARPTPCLFV